jgi:methionine synthase II (cobalamin-independent)
MSFHAGTIESFLRPPHLLETPEKERKREIGIEELRKVEDAAIKELVEKQVTSGLNIVTDG